MVTRTHPLSQQLLPSKPNWRYQLQQAINTPEALLEALALPPELLKGAQEGHQQFRIRVPHAFVERMERGNTADPLLRQVLPLKDEAHSPDYYLSDPVGDLASSKVPGLLHKYQGRVLLIATGACAINCRYCFRREFPYSGQSAASAQFGPALDYIAQHADIHEVILSGGDPLLLRTRQLRQLSEQLAQIPHIRRLRIHTRLPIVLPDRITDDLLAWTQQLPWPLAVVVHCNHAQELDATTVNALQRWRHAGAHMLNQSVLLKGVNDSAPAQSNLAQALYQAGVLPYYLHLLDRVKGSAHFEVNSTQAQVIMEQLRLQLSGYLVPRLVREQAGAPYKLPVL